MSLDYDLRYMGLALNEVREAMHLGNLPIGAVLLIEGKVIGIGRNNQVNNSDFYSHAESVLIGKSASWIKDASKEGKKVELFTTLEPCLMCFGTAVHTRVNRIVYACPDPLAGATGMEPPSEWYKRRWPEITKDVFRDDAFELFTNYMRGHLGIWRNALRQYEEMRKSW
ncbi:MAG: nucleoside deaminase [Nanoarchaeota archaeon]